MKTYTRHALTLLAVALCLPLTLRAQSTVYMGSSTASIFDHSSNNTTGIGVNYVGSGSSALRGLQLSIDINSANLQPTSVTLGSAIATPSNWSFDYQITNAATGSSIEIILYGKTSADVLASGDHAQMFVVHYNVPDIALCNSGLGGDIVTGVLSFAGVSSTKNDGLGSTASVAIDGTRPTHTVTVYNQSSRGDVDCNDRVDVLDLSKTINVAIRRTTFAVWQKNRADMAPWSSVWATPGTFFSDATNYGDNTVNISDVVLMADAILNAQWPDNKPLYGTKQGDQTGPDGFMAKQSAAADVTLSCMATASGVQVWIANTAPVSALQFVLHVPDAPEAIEARLNAAFDGKFTALAKRIGDEIRVVIYSATGGLIAPQSVKLLELPMAIDPTTVSIGEQATVSDVDGNALMAKSQTLDAGSDVSTAGEAVGMTIAPNPAREQVEVSFTLAEAGAVTIEIYASDGRMVGVPVTGQSCAAGRCSQRIGVDGLQPGTYTLRMTAGTSVSTQRFVVVR